MLKNHFTRFHFYIFAGLLLLAMVLTFLMLSTGSESDLRERPILVTSLLSFLGPFTGAQARYWQVCCTEFSLRLLPYCGMTLLVGVLFQFLPLPLERFATPLRLSTWTVGLLGWFVGIPISFLHSLS